MAEAATLGRPRVLVILAAGTGSRLEGETLPKPLVPILGVPLIVRALVQFQRVGVERAVVVVGHRGDEIRAALSVEPRLKLKMTFVENAEWTKKNGISVLCAAPHVAEEFYLSMSDHVFEAALLARLCEAECPRDGVALAVDRKLDSIYDMDDAMKVVVADGLVTTIAKDLHDFNAVDTGLFRATPALFDALESVKRDGDCSLADGCRALATRGRLAAVDVGAARWQDVDTPGSKPVAEQLLLDGLRKPLHDGIVSTNVNRPISLAITRRIAPTSVTPNQVSVVTALLALLGAFAVAEGGYWWPLIGAFLFQWNSILDGVDGEIARVKFLGSKVGEWVDTLIDDGSNIVFFIGMTVAAYRETGNDIFPLVGGLTLLLSLSATALMYRRLILKGSGDLNLILVSFTPRDAADTMGALLSKLKYLLKKDFFILLFFVLAVCGVLRVGFWIYACGMPFLFLAVVMQSLPKRVPVRERDAV